jgi:predicted transcriptional regulator
MELHPRERQIMDVIFRRGKATAAEVLRDLDNPPSYSAVRAMLGKLERKGHLTHERDGLRFVYQATAEREQIGETALSRLLRTFFEGSPTRAVAAILDAASGDLTNDELDELSDMIRRARDRGQR